jgi:hypothetical protein
MTTLTPDGVDFTGARTGFIFLQRGGRTYNVHRVYFLSLSPDITEYGLTIKELDYPAYIRRGLSGMVDDYAVGPEQNLIVTAAPVLRDDIIEYANWGYGRPGVLYLTIEDDDSLIWRFSDHVQEQP